MKRFSKRPISDSKIALLKAAGELFADRGIDGVSLREITQSAGANLAAVNYHFGSREGLVMNLVAMHLQPLWEERQVRMEAAERRWGAKVIPLEELVDLWLRPLPGLMKRSVLGEAVSLGVTGRMMMMAETEHPAELRAVTAMVTHRLLKALAKAVPGVEGHELAWRLDWVHGALARLLAGPWGANGTPLTQLDAVCVSFVRFAVAGFREGGSVVAVNRGTGLGPQVTFDF
jgi:AcrR family transcriptional regulator